MASSPDLLPAALLSEAAYQGKTKALGWAGIPAQRRLESWEAELLREGLADGLPPTREQIARLRESFWLDDLQETVSREIKGGGMDREGREALARQLWVALFARPYGPKTLGDRLEERGQATSSEWDEAGLSRPGVWRDDEVHCSLFAKVWTPESGFHPDRVWVAIRGTEMGARALGTTLGTAGDYMDLYRNFPKAWRASYKGASDALAASIAEQPERMRPKEVICVGHSFGGAMAQEAVLQGGGEFERLGAKPRAITFGNPGTGEMGIVTGVAAALGIAAFAMIGLGKWARDRLGLGKASGGMARVSEGWSLKAREAFVGVCGALAQVSKIGPWGELNAQSQMAWNLRDGMILGSEFGGWRSGWVGFRDEEGRRRANEPGAMAHVANRRDLVPAIGDASGFDFPGERIFAEPGAAASANPVADHAMGLYAKTAQDLLVAGGQGDHPWMRSLEGCRRAVDGMLEIQARLHADAVSSGMEMAFIREQLRSSRYADEREAPRHLRSGLAKAERNIAKPRTALLEHIRRGGSDVHIGGISQEMADAISLGRGKEFCMLVHQDATAMIKAKELSRGAAHFCAANEEEEAGAANPGKPSAALAEEMAWLRSHGWHAKGLVKGEESLEAQKAQEAALDSARGELPGRAAREAHEDIRAPIILSEYRRRKKMAGGEAATPARSTPSI